MEKQFCETLGSLANFDGDYRAAYEHLSKAYLGMEKQFCEMWGSRPARDHAGNQSAQWKGSMKLSERMRKGYVSVEVGGYSKREGPLAEGFADEVAELESRAERAEEDSRRLDWLSQKHITGTIAIDAKNPIDRKAVIWGASRSPREAIDAAKVEGGS